MSLSSKLREFRKELMQMQKGKPTKGKEFKDEQLVAIARYMPRDADSLGKILSSEQMDAFGNELLSLTCAHTSRDQAKFEDCLLEFGAFVRGGLPGMDVLNRVYPRILQHYGVADDMEEVFEALKLYVNLKQNKLKRKWVKEEEEGDEEQEEESAAAKRVKLSQ